jgi:hypothetical protein
MLTGRYDVPIICFSALHGRYRAYSSYVIIIIFFGIVISSQLHVCVCVCVCVCVMCDN